MAIVTVEVVPRIILNYKVPHSIVSFSLPLLVGLPSKSNSYEQGRSCPLVRCEPPRCRSIIRKREYGCVSLCSRSNIEKLPLELQSNLVWRRKHSGNGLCSEKGINGSWALGMFLQARISWQGSWSVMWQNKKKLKCTSNTRKYVK